MTENAHDFLPGVTDEEAENRRKTGLLAKISAYVEKEKQKAAEELADEFDELMRPDRSLVPEITNRQGETVHRLTSPLEAIYRRLPEEVRAIRNPETDHWMAEEWRGIVFRDSSRVFLARAKADEYWGRASTLEGTPGVSGAYATGTGGSLISRPNEQLVLIARDKVSKMPTFASSFQMTKFTHTIPTAAAVAAYMTLEGGDTTVGEPTYSFVQLNARKAAARVIMSREQLADSDFNLVSVLTTRAGMALGALQEAEFWRTGGTAPSISAIAAGVTYTPSETATALDFTSVSDCYYTLPQVYRQNAAWYSASDVLGFLNNVRDGNGRPFYQGLGDGPRPLTDDAGAVGTLMGRPVYEVDATAGTIHFGDMSALYIIGQRSGLEARSSEHSNFTAGLVELIFEQRFDGNNVDTSAAQTMTGITSANSL